MRAAVPTFADHLRRRGVDTVILAGADTHGIMRGKRIPIAELARAAEHGIALCEVIWALPVDESEPVQPPPEYAGYFPRAGYPDMLAFPDLETARVVPWHEHTALVLCDFVDGDGSTISLSPRAVLRSVVERARSMGFEPIVGVEKHHPAAFGLLSVAQALNFREAEITGGRDAPAGTADQCHPFIVNVGNNLGRPVR